MPHKRNPILSERIAGLARLLRGYAQTALEDQPLWHERDISHSSAERVDPARRDDPARLHAGADDRPHRGARRPVRADAREHRARPRPARQRRACSSRSSRRPGSAARRPTRSSSAPPCGRPTSGSRCATSWRVDPAVAQKLSLDRPRRLLRRERRSCATSTRSSPGSIASSRRPSCTRPRRSPVLTADRVRPLGQGPRPVRAARRPAAARRLRPDQRLRRRPADDDPGQGPRPDRPVAVLVRRDASRSSRTTCSVDVASSGRLGGRHRRAGVRRPAARVDDFASWRGRVMVCRRPTSSRSRPSSAATSPAPAGRSTRRPATSAASGCPQGLRESDRLPEPIFTPATKAEQGEHDENIDFDDDGPAHRPSAGLRRSRRARSPSRPRSALALYRYASALAARAGILLADTKFEFGRRPGTDELILIDEVLTPDSSRFWDATTYEPGRPQAQLRQAVRARLARAPAVGQDGARAGAARRRRRAARARATSRRSSGSPAPASSAISRRTSSPDEHPPVRRQRHAQAGHPRSAGPGRRGQPRPPRDRAASAPSASGAGSS